MYIALPVLYSSSILFAQTSPCSACPVHLLFAQTYPCSACPVPPLRFSLLKFLHVLLVLNPSSILFLRELLYFLSILYPPSILFAQTLPCSACPVLLFDSLCSFFSIVLPVLCPSWIPFAQTSPCSVCRTVQYPSAILDCLLKLLHVLPLLYPSLILFVQTSPCSASAVSVFDSLCSNFSMFCLCCTPL